MYVLTSIRELDTSSEHCVDRCVQDPRHRVSDFVVGLRAGDSWQCGETRMGDSEDMFASTQEEEQEGRIQLLSCWESSLGGAQLDVSLGCLAFIGVHYKGE